ncbi:bifunctional riboflavin kinase/FMN adenylyltransferase [Coprothermobacteraceae bacterium]|nr:bifunctional riboflavin kinase/FMN adenylyltransferase [Coprothermobacteraceae bacterium]
MVVVQSTVPELKIVALGGFESLHVGHRKLLRHVAGVPNGAVLSFSPLPKEALGRSPSRVLLEEERRCGLESMGVAYMVSLPFNDIRGMEAEHFLDTYMSGVEVIVVGENFRFGRGAAGDVALMDKWCREHGKTLLVEPLERVGEAVVSTRLIKDLIHQGDMVGASALLGYPYFIRGFRCKGYGRGSRLGIPTINLRWNIHKVKPAYGVYDGFVMVGRTWAPAVASFGTAPTFGREAVFLEIHVPKQRLAVNDNEPVLFAFHRFLRPEMRFESVDTLVAQINDDIRAMTEDLEAISEQKRYLDFSFASSCLLSFK